MNDDLMHRRLPKWPQMVVTGKSIAKEQALDIIKVTDDFMKGYDGNDKDFIKKARKALRLPEDKDYWAPEFTIIEDGKKVHKDKEYRDWNNKFYSEVEAWKNAWGVINTEYVSNSWISCPFIGGCHGWCHPDGTIGYSDNVGKWPEVEEIYNDWVMLANEFPFLEIGVTLIDSESSEPNELKIPVVSFKIKNGTVELIDPTIENVHKEHTSTPVDEFNGSNILNFLFKSENVLPLEVLEIWGKEFEEKLNK